MTTEKEGTLSDVVFNDEKKRGVERLVREEQWESAGMFVAPAKPNTEAYEKDRAAARVQIQDAIIVDIVKGGTPITTPRPTHPDLQKIYDDARAVDGDADELARRACTIALLVADLATESVRVRDSNAAQIDELKKRVPSPRGRYFYEPRPQRDNDFSTRNTTTWWTHAEFLIQDAVDAVEKLGASTALTDAVCFLSEARACVADHIEGIAHEVPTYNSTMFVASLVSKLKDLEDEAKRAHAKVADEVIARPPNELLHWARRMVSRHPNGSDTFVVLEDMGLKVTLGSLRAWVRAADAP